MTAFIVCGCILAALFLIGLIRVGVIAEYSAAGLLVRLKLGPVHMTVYPMKKKPPKGEKKEKVKKKAEEPEKKTGGSFSSLKQYLPLVCEAAGRFRRKLCVDRIHLDFTAAAAAPAAAAMSFGYANAAIGMLWPLLENNFKMKDRRVRTAVAFNAASPTVYLYLAASLSIGQSIVLSLRLAIGFLKITSDAKTQKKTEKEAV